MQTRGIKRKRSVEELTELKRVQKDIAYKRDMFLGNPTVKVVAKTVMISGTILGMLYLSKYFLRATAKMIRCCKEVRDAWRE